MILKGRDSFFKVPAVETVSRSGRSDDGRGQHLCGARTPDTRTGAGEPEGRREIVLGEAMACIAAAIREANGPLRMTAVKRPPGRSGGRVLELVFDDDSDVRANDDVFKVSYDVELRFMLSRGKISASLVPTSFIQTNE